MTNPVTSVLRGGPKDGLGQALSAARLFFIAPGWGRVLFLAYFLTGMAMATGIVIDADLHISTTALAIFGLAGFLPSLASMTLEIEIAQARPLAYFELLPQRVRPLHLVLWPMRFLGIIGAILFATLGHLPPLAVLIITACAWWSISVGHWLAGYEAWRRGLALLLVLAQALVVGTLADAGSLPAAAVCAVAIAIVGQFIPRRTTFGRLLVRHAAPPRARGGAKGTVLHRACVVLNRPRRRWGTSYRLFKVAASTSPGPRWLMVGVFSVLIVTSGVVAALSFSAYSWAQWIVVAIIAGGTLTRTTDSAAADFFITLPLTARRRFAATVMPWMGMVLVAPMAQALLIKASVAAAPVYTVDNSACRTFTILGVPPQSFAHVGRQLRVTVTDDLLWLLYQNSLRMACLGLAILFVSALNSIARQSTPRLRWAIRGLTLAVGATVLPYFLVPFGLRRWTLPPLWLAALLAGIAAVLFFRRVFSRTTEY